MHIFNHRNVSSRQQQDPLFRRIWNDPYLDWSIMLVCATVLILAASFLGYRVYSYVHGALNDPLQPSDTISRAVLDRQALTDVLRDFDARETRRAGIIRGVDVPVDPSM